MEKDIITLGIFAHANAGKTTITENLLYQTGVISQIGKVDSGDTITDSLKIEKERGISIRSALVNFEIGSKKIQLIDTPGHVDFSAEVERSISVLDAAILVISGADGVEAQTYPIWRSLRKKNIPIIIFINKMDRDGADYNKTIKQMQEELHPAFVPIIDVTKNEKNITLKQFPVYSMLEKLGEFDDESLEAYLEYEKNKIKYNQFWIEEKTKNLIKEKKIFPVIGGTALHEVGIDSLISCIEKYLPPFQRNETEKFSAYIYSIRIENTEDIYAKILTGRIKKREEIRTDVESFQKIKDIKTMSGGTPLSVEEAKSGDIVILNGISAQIGSIIGEISQHKNFEQIHFVQPLLNMSVKNQKGSMQELLEALRILEKEDPYLQVKHGGKAGEILISLMGEVQAQVISQMLYERFKIQAEITNPTIICKETPIKKGIGKCSYTRVSGIELEVEPLPEGSGFIFESKVETGTLHKKYQRQAEKLINQYKYQGLFGWELSDMKVTLTDGRFDSMGSETIDFNISVPIAFFRALKNAQTKILEPICNYIIKADDKDVKQIALRLQARNSLFKLKPGIGSETFIFGEARLKDLLNFPLELKKITKGRGEYSYEFSSYKKSHDQTQSLDFIGKDPRNETFFVINEMGGSLVPLDEKATKKKNSSAKFAWKQMKKELHR